MPTHRQGRHHLDSITAKDTEGTDWPPSAWGTPSEMWKKGLSETLPSQDPGRKARDQAEDRRASCTCFPAGSAGDNTGSGYWRLPEQLLPRVAPDRFQVPFWMQKPSALQHPSKRAKPLSHQLWILANNSKLFHLPASLKTEHSLRYLENYVYGMRMGLSEVSHVLQCQDTLKISFSTLDFHTLIALHNLELHWTALFINEVYVLSIMLSTLILTSTL